MVEGVQQGPVLVGTFFVVAEVPTRHKALHYGLIPFAWSVCLQWCATCLELCVCVCTGVKQLSKSLGCVVLRSLTIHSGVYPS